MLSSIKSIDGMGKYEVVLEHYTPKKTIIKITCECGKTNEVRIEAVLRQKKRGRQKYTCLSCASKKAWTYNKRKRASDKSKENWQDPVYAGTIIGKAIARQII